MKKNLFYLILLFISFAFINVKAACRYTFTTTANEELTFEVSDNGNINDVKDSRNFTTFRFQADDNTKRGLLSNNCNNKIYLEYISGDGNRNGAYIDYRISLEPVEERFANRMTTSSERIADKEGTPVNTCEGLIGPNVMSFIKLASNIIMIVGPIIALVWGTYDLIVALASGEEDAKKKGMKNMKNRLVAAMLLLLVPYIIPLLLSIVNKGSNCL